MADNPKFEVCESEVSRPGPTYTVDTLEELSSKFGPSTGLFFILGMDALLRLGEWKDPDRILELCRLVVVTRPGYSRMDWPQFYANHPRAEHRVEIVALSAADISGTELRKRIASDSSLRGLLPEPVQEYIRAHGLYRGEAESDE